MRGKKVFGPRKEVGSDQQKRGCVSEKQRLMEESGKQIVVGKLENKFSNEVESIKKDFKCDA